MTLEVCCGNGCRCRIENGGDGTKVSVTGGRYAANIVSTVGGVGLISVNKYNYDDI